MTNRYNTSLTIVLFMIFIFFTNIWSSNLSAQTPLDSSSNTDNWYRISPISEMSLRTYYLPENHPFVNYHLFNSDGEFIKKGMNSFLQVKGSASLLERFFFQYRLQLQDLQAIYFQRLNFSYRDKSVSFLAGLDSVWLGHGYHGSLLLSNNAPPFRVVKFQTEKPFRIPYVGKFSYLLFNGWAENFKVLGQRIGYFPVPWLEFGINQTVVYKRNYKFWEFFKILSASQENLPGHYNNDQRASMDVALHLNFLKSITPLTNGKIYFEYAGEDIHAWWQPEDDKWLGPIGIEFFDPGITTGFWFETENTIMRGEYSQNYSIKNIFYSVHTEQFKSYQLYTKKWYRTIPFLNYGSLMGHHMGPEADDLYFEVQHRVGLGSFKLFYHKERHGLASGYGTVFNVSHDPENFIQIGGEFSYKWNNLNTSFLVMKNYYKNIDRHPDLLEIISQRGSTAQSLLLGLTLSYKFN
ncbi:MAG: capsule assembly Wzi family protein [Bacteroidota bacterium]|nr:capsule assembly Wzi family protein [Bacteroidota bacterium]